MVDMHDPLKAPGLFESFAGGSWLDTEEGTLQGTYPDADAAQKAVVVITTAFARASADTLDQPMVTVTGNTVIVDTFLLPIEAIHAALGEGRTAAESTTQDQAIAMRALEALLPGSTWQVSPMNAYVGTVANPGDVAERLKGLIDDNGGNARVSVRLADGKVSVDAGVLMQALERMAETQAIPETDVQAATLRRLEGFVGAGRQESYAARMSALANLRQLSEDERCALLGECFGGGWWRDGEEYLVTGAAVDMVAMVRNVLRETGFTPDDHVIASQNPSNPISGGYQFHVNADALLTALDRVRSQAQPRPGDSPALG